MGCDRYVDVPGVSVLDAAQRRIARLFDSGFPLCLLLSGGKDSLCLHDLMMGHVLANPDSVKRLVVAFFDEEAVFPECRELMLDLRERWLSVGVPFRWFALPLKHNNCFHTLEDLETWVTFDPTCEDRWVCQPPPFAERTNPMLKYPGQWNYQQAAALVFPRHLRVCGVRVSESIQRGQAFRAQCKRNGGDQDLDPHVCQYPLWDWRDRDVWYHIRLHNLPYPRCYEKLYAMNGKGKLRLSQVYSIDTAKTLARMAEYYPEFWERICIREPNAYLAAMYYDSEMFRRAEAKAADGVDHTDYKAKTWELLKSGKFSRACPVRGIVYWIVSLGVYFTEKDWADAYRALYAGDPKQRTFRAMIARVSARKNK